LERETDERSAKPDGYSILGNRPRCPGWLPRKTGSSKLGAQPPVQESQVSQAQCGDCIPVTPDNFVRAESDMYFRGVVKNGGFGKFDHTRDPAPLDKQTVIRLNRETLYPPAVFDLDAGPVIITLPDSGKRFMSLQMIDED
jgi:hypothetical protein